MIQGVTGHKEAQDFLNIYVPQVVLLRGPEGVGKSTLAHAVAEHLGVMSLDVWHIEHLAEGEARALVDSGSLPSAFDGNDVTIINLDGAKDNAANMLLKLLEEPPKFHYYILLATEEPPATIASRAVILNMGGLKPEELSKVLAEHSDVPASSIDAVKHMGTVKDALWLYQNQPAKNVVQTVFHAVDSGDLELFHEAYGSVDDIVENMIYIALVESATGRFRVFARDELGKFGEKRVALPLVVSLAQPGMSYRVVLERLIGKIR